MHTTLDLLRCGTLWGSLRIRNAVHEIVPVENARPITIEALKELQQRTDFMPVDHLQLGQHANDKLKPIYPVAAAHKDRQARRE